MDVSDAGIGNMVDVVVSKPNNERQQSVNTGSTERLQSFTRASADHPQSWVLHLKGSMGRTMAFTDKQRIGSLCGKKRRPHGQSPSLKINFNSASMILGVASGVIKGCATAFSYNRSIGCLNKECS
jgi:hypothetical protein